MTPTCITAKQRELFILHESDTSSSLDTCPDVLTDTDTLVSTCMV